MAGDRTYNSLEHRWEFDKQPEEFFAVLYRLKDSSLRFHLRVLGENFQAKPKVFEEARVKLEDFIDHWGFVKDRNEYYRHLRESQIVISTAIQENFGISVVNNSYGLFSTSTAETFLSRNTTDFISLRLFISRSS